MPHGQIGGVNGGPASLRDLAAIGVTGIHHAAAIVVVAIAAP
jgi:hypothetical protein